MKKSYLVASLAGLTLIGLSSMPVSIVGQRLKLYQTVR